MNNNSDIISQLLTLEKGWIIILILQGIYLSLDSTEAATGKITYGIVASIFMGILGLIIFLYSIVEISKNKHENYRGLIESIFYMTFSVIILYFKLKKKKEMKNVKKDN